MNKDESVGLTYVKGELLVLLTTAPGQQLDTTETINTLFNVWQEPNVWATLNDNLKSLERLGVVENLPEVQKALTGLSKVSPPQMNADSHIKSTVSLPAPEGASRVVYRVTLPPMEDSDAMIDNLIVATNGLLNNLVAPRNRENVSTLNIVSVNELLNTPLAALQVQVNSYILASTCYSFEYPLLSAQVFPAPIEPIIEGGPGAVPVPYELLLDRNGTFKPDSIPYVFKDLSQFKSAGGVNNEGQDVAVFILDTIPSKQVLDDALVRYPNHPLLTSLMKDNPNCTLELVSPLSEANKNTKFQNNRHPLNDHGLFIAGLVHSIAPKAKIYLVEALNEYGIGTEAGILNAIAASLEIASDNNHDKVIFNCSWRIAYAPDVATGGNIIGSTFATSMLGISTTPGGQTPPKALVVAAAGNAANPTKPDKPADFTPVFGVAALNRDGTDASYSNRPEQAGGKDPGFKVFGGEIEPLPAAGTGGGNPPKITDKDDGILGLCITNFVVNTYNDPNPDNWDWSQNHHGWGRWAGTSFATGVLSGVMALLGSNGYWDTTGQPAYENVTVKVAAISGLPAYKINLTQETP
jgi:hypothetical protein